MCQCYIAASRLQLAIRCMHQSTWHREHYVFRERCLPVSPCGGFPKKVKNWSLMYLHESALHDYISFLSRPDNICKVTSHLILASKLAMHFCCYHNGVLMVRQLAHHQDCRMCAKFWAIAAVWLVFACDFCNLCVHGHYSQSVLYPTVNITDIESDRIDMVNCLIVKFQIPNIIRTYLSNFNVQSCKSESSQLQVQFSNFIFQLLRCQTSDYKMHDSNLNFPISNFIFELQSYITRECVCECEYVCDCVCVCECVCVCVCVCVGSTEAMSCYVDWAVFVIIVIHIYIC